MVNEEMALILDDAAEQARPIEQLSHRKSFSLTDAYAIQRFSIGLRLSRGETMVGLKMGFTSEAKMKQMGVNDLIWGRLTSSMMLPNGATLPWKGFIHPRAEPEIAFRISRTIDREIDLESLPDYVDGMCAAIEVIDSRYEHFKFSLEDVVADNCSSAAFVLGPWQQPKRQIGDLKMQQSFDDEVVAEGSSFDIMGDPWKSLQHASRLAAQDGEPIKAGYVVLAGASTAAEFLKPGIEVRAKVQGMEDAWFRVSE